VALHEGLLLPSALPTAAPAPVTASRRQRR
jgi:hypothetical protein